MLVLSKPETVELVEDASVPDDSEITHIYYVQKEFHSGSKAIFEKEVYVTGNAYIGENNQLRALACDGDVTISNGTKFLRWLHAEGSVITGESCSLGVSASAGKVLSLAPRCSFKRLYGFPIITGFSSNRFAEDSKDFGTDDIHLAVFENRDSVRDLSYIQPNSREDCSFVTVRSLTIGDLAMIRGHVKSHGNIISGSGVIIAGNLFAEGDIHLGANSYVQGNVFAQGRVILDQDVTVGSPGKIKSVIGKRGISCGRGVKVYGYVATEGEGYAL